MVLVQSFDGVMASEKKNDGISRFVPLPHAIPMAPPGWMFKSQIVALFVPAQSMSGDGVPLMMVLGPLPRKITSDFIVSPAVSAYVPSLTQTMPPEPTSVKPSDRKECRL